MYARFFPLQDGKFANRDALSGHDGGPIGFGIPVEPDVCSTINRSHYLASSNDLVCVVVMFRSFTVLEKIDEVWKLVQLQVLHMSHYY